MAETEIKQEPTTRRVVGVLSALYFKQDTDLLTGNRVRRVLSARHGEEIDIPESEERRLDSIHALLPKGSRPEDAQKVHDARLDAYRAQRGDVEALARHNERVGGQIVDVEAPVGGSTGELAAYIRDHKLTVDDTVALAEDDPAKAQRVLEAEREASGGNPRQGVEQRLSKLTEG